jgi:hypothetical protein
MIYGYSRRVVNEYGLMEMREITFAETPEDLRTIGEYLVQMADLAERGGFERTSHRHISSTVAGWSKTHPTVDIIVSPSGMPRTPPPVVE